MTDDQRDATATSPTASIGASIGPSTAARSGSGIDRRTLLRGALGVGGLAVGGSVLAACSSSGSKNDAATTPSSSSSATSGTSTSASAPAPGSLGAVSLRLSWIKNVEFAGSFIADSKGYYKDAGFTTMNLISGGPTATPQDVDVATGKAMFGISSPDITGTAISKGAPLIIIGAQYQKNPFCIMSLAKSPIVKPEDMYGKKIGVQATNESVWQAYVKAAKIDASKITKVPVQFDPIGLTTGEVDGWFSFVTHEPIDLGLQGFKVTTMLLADTGYPLVSETYMTTTSLLKSKPEVVKAFLTAEIKGWKDNITDPASGATLAANTYGKGLKLTVKEQTLESTAENKLILNADTTANGLFTVTDALIEENLKTLAIGGLNLTAEKLFDFSILKSIYTENPSLI
jgi:ABC-type nitrate/sulfonate/bicarbonate transport system substrate-binding protein